ncbi:putative LRR receptor-like serine/threonine-protein kinase [Cinnamomum micranthum f. kanehirae]|uniref:non-specific serine/threonine protein kinase n=1 Tax=Cinnamomum micranthum f. kanehirae TaxID=337451 RepID=A0A443NI81_9MAGN|nr:putative LRR receptor-like serine/threonine-protein kinase [Cinnamomum micranthum f. kanehirae]
MRMVLHLFVWVFLALAIRVHGQQEGFLSIDCGIAGDLSYTDDTTQMFYTSDTKFIDTGTNKEIATTYMTQTLPRQYQNLRIFPNVNRNCYTLTPVIKSNRYLLRASFMYGNYDGLDQPPQFDAYLGVDRWEIDLPSNSSLYVWNEIIMVASLDYISVCLVNTGNGTPFISALELRLLDNSTYQAATESQYLQLYTRLDPGSTSGKRIRYPDDDYDRIWSPWVENFWTPINTSFSINLRKDVGYQPALAVMNTAAMPTNTSANLSFYFPTSNVDPRLQYHVFMHFAELEQLQKNQSREFNFSLDGKYALGPFSPTYLSVNTIFTMSPLSGQDQHVVDLYKTMSSTLPPILNAVEVFIVKQLTSPTDGQDVDAIMNIKAIYQIKRNWMGDPCLPVNYSWNGLNCSYPDSSSPTNISLDLSSSGLTGEIAPSLANLTSIQSLDVSNNSLTGPVPEFLTELPSLKFMNLSNNNLTGAIPTVLLERLKNGSLSLSVGNNPNLIEPSNVNVNNDINPCQVGSCKKRRKVLVPVLASVIPSLVLLTIAIFVLWKLSQRRHQRDTESVVKAKEEVGSISQRKSKDGSLRLENQRFTYAEIIAITNNFETVIGEGGFGVVYHGYVKGAIQVAVKMLSKSSSQGSREYRTEAKLLMRVHHKNLASFIGYCDEDRNKGIIYEYMANGNLREYLSGNTYVLTWGMRLRIALDAAQGLEYLHHGCKPPIIHRDVKATNILLNEGLEAKIADFGLSKVFPVEGLTHVSTAVMGTLGYLDPEYYISNKLNEKSDVFSFGIVLLEIITGKTAIIRSSERMHILLWIGPLIARGEITTVVDPRLAEYDVNSAWKAVEIAMECTLDTSIKRPTMSIVVNELKECLALERARERTFSSRREEADTRSSNSIEMLPNHMRSMAGPIAR